MALFTHRASRNFCFRMMYRNLAEENTYRYRYTFTCSKGHLYGYFYFYRFCFCSINSVENAWESFISHVRWGMRGLRCLQVSAQLNVTVTIYNSKPHSIPCNTTSLWFLCYLFLSNFSMPSNGWMNCITSSHWPSRMSCLVKRANRHSAFKWFYREGGRK